MTRRQLSRIRRQHQPWGLGRATRQAWRVLRSPVDAGTRWWRQLAVRRGGVDRAHWWRSRARMTLVTVVFGSLAVVFAVWLLRALIVLVIGGRAVAEPWGFDP